MLDDPQVTKKDIYSSILYNDIKDIVNDKDSDHIKTQTVKVSAKLHSKDYDLNKTDDQVHINHIHFIRNYVSNITDYIEIELKVLIGFYMNKIYPYLANLEISLIFEPNEKKPGNTTYIERYKAVYLKDKNIQIPTNLQATEVDSNQLGFVNVTFQLLDRSVEGLRVKTIYGSFDKTITKDKNSATIKIDEFLRAAIAQESSKVIIGGKRSIEAIDIEKPDNQEKILRYTIPSGINIIRLAKYFQDRSMGIYNMGCGSYIQTYKGKKTFFVYSLYSHKKYKESKYKTIIYVPMTNAFSTQKNTYRYVDNTLRILVMPNNNLTDIRESNLMSEGNGFKVSNAKSIMRKPVELTKDGPVFKRSLFVTEVATSDRKDSMNFAPLDEHDRVNYNLFKKTSDIAAKAGTIYTFVWKNSNMFHIYPGAPVKINVENSNGKLLEFYGIIHKVTTTYSSTATASGGAAMNTGKEFDVSSVLNVFVLKSLVDFT